MTPCDTDGKLATARRLRALDVSAATCTRFVARHFPWPGLGHDARSGSGFRCFAFPMRLAP